MPTRTSRSIARLLILVVLLLAACTPPPTGEAEIPTPTPTPTRTPAADPTHTPTPPASLCSGLTGEIEVQVLVGPSDAVGLEPVAVGSVPFAVSTTSPYQVIGSGTLDYDDVLTRKWGSFSVSFDLCCI